MLELARPQDRERIDSLAREVHAMHGQWRPDIYEMPQEMYPAERFDAAVKERQLYAAKLGGITVGYALLRMHLVDQPGLRKRKIMLVDELCVEKGFRNQGIGRQMVEDIHALAKAFRCTDLQLGVYPQNDVAVGFYQKCGFQIQNITMQKSV